MRILMMCLLVLSSFVYSDSHTSEEKEVLAAVKKLYDARNARDFATVVSMESRTGVYSTMSDGSFHKPVVVSSVEMYKKNFPAGTTNVHFPEAIKLSDDAYYVRFYYEGVTDPGNKPYRTRVTTTWVKEKRKWVLKSQHYSSADYGSTHTTTKGDFENQ